MSDLRTGLVEAMARIMNDMTGNIGMAGVAEAALDAALGFLADNAPEGLVPFNSYDLIAALSDSRDTGEKPDG